MSTRTAAKLLITGAAVLAATVAGVATAQAADAGTVSVQGGTVTFRAGDDVANRLDVLHTQDGFFSLIDDAAPVTLSSSARNRCTLEDEIVRCSGISSIRLELGNRNDRLFADGFARLRASGGSGNDNLAVSAAYEGAVTFQGDSGNDVLIGGDRNDRLEAGSGRNQRTEGNGGRDFCSGSDVVKVSCED